MYLWLNKLICRGRSLRFKGTKTRVVAIIGLDPVKSFILMQFWFVRSIFQRSFFGRIGADKALRFALGAFQILFLQMNMCIIIKQNHECSSF